MSSLAPASLGSRMAAFARTLFGKKAPEPSYPALPAVDEKNQSSVPGLYLAGEIAGTPLIKLGLNQGVAVMDHIARDLRASPPREGEDAGLDVLIVGAGSSGLSAAMRAHQLELHVVVVESERLANTVVNMHRGKVLYAEPAGVENQSGMWFEECTREELLERWRAQVNETGLDVREGEKVTDIQRRGDGFDVTTTRARYRARRVLLAVGKAGNPRKAGVPGEDTYAHRVHHALSDPDAFEGKRVLVYGGGDVACEAALALCERNEVTLVTVDETLHYPSKRNQEAVRARVREGKLRLHLGARLTAIEEHAVRFEAPSESGAGREGREEHVLPNDLVFEMIGAELPLELFRRAGIQLENAWGFRRYAYLLGVFLFVYSLYALKKFPESPYAWPFDRLLSHEAFARVSRALFEPAFAPFRWLFTDAAYADIQRTLWFQTGYLYSLVYTVVMLVFGATALRRWSRVARDPRYQRWRYASLIAFQVVFFLGANVVAVQALSLQHAWRAWGLYQPWPLFFHTFHWWNQSDPRVVLYGFVGAGLFGTFVAIPVLSYKHGKRFCTWVCGCGGLAETLGDRWRHLAPKGKRSRAWEFQNLVVLAAAMLATAVSVGAYGTRADNAWALAYAYVVDFWLVAVIPIALYPFFGGKVWCRYWCPLAAWNQLLARWYGRLRITANEKCISCTKCSRHCQVGVDVMAFAKQQEAFDNRNSSCIQCGICIDVCPMDVLRFDSSPRQKTRHKTLPVVG